VSSARGLLTRRSRDDVSRAQRVERVLVLVERFVFDLGLLIAGEPTELRAYVDARVIERLEQSVQPALDAGALARPDFGEYAEVRIEDDLLDLSHPVSTLVEFDDCSSLTRAGGFAPAPHRRRMRLRLLLDAALTRVLDHHLEPAGLS
jgi:hypothetical protein